MPKWNPPHRTGRDAQRNRNRELTDKERIARAAGRERMEVLAAHRADATKRRRPAKMGQHFHPSQFKHLPPGPATGH